MYATLKANFKFARVSVDRPPQLMLRTLQRYTHSVQVNYNIAVMAIREKKIRKVTQKKIPRSKTPETHLELFPTKT